MSALDHGSAHRLERLVFFSDAVFAIAITLLVIELHPPHLHYGQPFAEQAEALLRLVPEFWGFAVSFWVIGAFWAGHHRAFALAAHWDERLIVGNLWFLLAIASTPFFTAFMSANTFARLPVMLYCAWLLGAALLNLNLQRRVLRAPVVAEDADPATLSTYRRRGWAVVLGAASALIASALVPYPAFGLALLLSMPVWRMVLARGGRGATA